MKIKRIFFYIITAVFITVNLTGISFGQSVIKPAMKELYWDKAVQFNSPFIGLAKENDATPANTKNIRLYGTIYKYEPKKYTSNNKTCFTKVYKDKNDVIYISVKGYSKITPGGKRKLLASRRGNFANNSIVNTAKDFLGVPYVWGGTSPSGFDCSGFVMRVFQMNGISITRLADDQYYNGSHISRDELVPGDLVFFTTYAPGVSHVGIYIGDDCFIHASSSGGVKISSLNEDYYCARYVGAARY